MTTSSLSLYWIPLGAGGHSVRLNGLVYEAVTAAIERRPRCELFHTALEITLPTGRYMVEMTPVPDGHGHRRGVVAEGPVGCKAAGIVRLFRYEVRRWHDGVIPDLDQAVGGRQAVTDDPAIVQAVFDLLPLVPTLTWGRDESRTGDMWSCNSILSWALTVAGLDTDAIPLPAGGRAPGWDAGTAVARDGAGAPFGTKVPHRTVLRP